MQISYLTKPTTPPVLLDEVKEHLRISGAESDAALASFIRSANRMLERATGLVLIEQRIRVQTIFSGPFHFPLRPLIALESVSVQGSDGTVSAVSPSDLDCTPGLFPVLVDPDISDRMVTIEARCGFGQTWNDVPDDLRQALLHLVLHLHTHRGDTTTKPLQDSGAASLLAPYRRSRL